MTEGDIINPHTHCKSEKSGAKSLATVCGTLTGDEPEHMDEAISGCSTANCILPLGIVRPPGVTTNHLPLITNPSNGRINKEDCSVRLNNPRSPSDVLYFACLIRRNWRWTGRHARRRRMRYSHGRDGNYLVGRSPCIYSFEISPTGTNLENRRSDVL